MIVIRLTGGRGTVTGQLVHINPNYVAVLVGGVERFVPQRIIATMKRV
jgi:hypothetical protein